MNIVSHLTLFIVFASPSLGLCNEEDQRKQHLAGKKSPLLESPKRSGMILGTYSSVQDPDTGIYIDPGAVGKEEFIMIKSLPKSDKLFSLPLCESFKLHSDRQEPLSSEGATRTMVFVDTPVEGVKRSIRYTITYQPMRKGIQEGATYYRLSITWIRGEVEVIHHKTFAATAHHK